MENIAELQKSIIQRNIMKKEIEFNPDLITLELQEIIT
jgi:hypothetical protein